MKPESNRPITIEDLLRLKRAERPPAEFWATFDRELRAKQLAALVGKRPWWQRIPGALSRASRYRVPLGASAVVALTFFTVRDYEPAAPVQEPKNEPAQIAVDVASDFSPAIAAAVSVASDPEPVVVAVVTGQSEPASAPPTVVAAKSDELPPVLPLGGVAISEDSQSQSPAARYIAANLAVVESSDPVNARGLLDVAT